MIDPEGRREQGRLGSPKPGAPGSRQVTRGRAHGDWWKDCATLAVLEPCPRRRDHAARQPQLLAAGITPAQAAARREGARPRRAERRRDVARCQALAGTGSTACWADLDRKVSADLVPWIPYLWRTQITILGPQVARWGWDQAVGTTAYAHVAVKR
jgi:hypothetical protein